MLGCDGDRGTQVKNNTLANYTDLELFEELIQRVRLQFGSIVITSRDGKWYQTSIGSCSAPHIVAYRGNDGLERYKNVKLS